MYKNKFNAYLMSHFANAHLRLKDFKYLAEAPSLMDI